MRGQFVVGVGYDADIQHAQQMAREITIGQENVLRDPEPQILIDELGSSTYNLKVYFWVDVEKTSVVKMSSVLMRNITLAFLEAGISMPDDAREIIFPQGLTVKGVNTARIEGINEKNEETEKSSSQLTSQSDANNQPSNEIAKPKGNKRDENDDDKTRGAVAMNADADNKDKQNSKTSAAKNLVKAQQGEDDVTSDAHEIREQARNSRDPEAGENIL